MATIKLYHGSWMKNLKPAERIGMYFSLNIDEAREFALCLCDDGSYNKESYIYSIEINEEDVTVIEDFPTFDSIGNAENYKNMPEVANYETWYCLKNAKNIELVEYFTNNLD